MIDNNFYVIRNPFIIQERVQPAYSQFILQYESIDFPIFVNASAAEVIRLCDGTKRIEEIYKILSVEYNESISDIESKLSDFWTMSANCNHITFSDAPPKEPLQLKTIGSRDYWTPDLISVELTHNCPLKCKHCFLSAGHGETMSKSTWNSIASSIFEMNIPQVQLTGGEPLLHPSFFDLLDELLSNNITVHVFTSGVIFSNALFKRFKEYTKKYLKKILFQISIDGLADYHDEFRGVQGSFERTVHFVQNIANLGFKTSVGVTVANQSFDELESLCKLCKNIGVSVVRIGGISNRGRAEINKISSQVAEIVNIAKIKSKLAAEFENDTFKVLLNEENADNKLSYLMNCGLGQTSIKIDPVGMVHPCMMATTVYADINKSSLLEIQKKYSRLFEKLTSPMPSSVCKNCTNQMICDKCIIEGYAHSSERSCAWMNNNIEILKELF